jgi:hypothetical protein
MGLPALGHLAEVASQKTEGTTICISVIEQLHPREKAMPSTTLQLTNAQTSANLPPSKTVLGEFPPLKKKRERKILIGLWMAKPILRHFGCKNWV